MIPRLAAQLVLLSQRTPSTERDAFSKTNMESPGELMGIKQLLCEGENLI